MIQPKKLRSVVHLSGYGAVCELCGKSETEIKAAKEGYTRSRTAFDTTYRNHHDFTRCGEPRDVAPPTGTVKWPLPVSQGFYWAKWRIADDETPADLAATLPVDIWEVVEVFLNHTSDDSDERFRVNVCGVLAGQSLENFVWGPGPLEPPK